eukprot:CAMPEP_0170604870 /NCGR_PEP_ID=MMETSP0224-20130122/19667_1 /TAXON_ID=285029 /ORGANISM="Togula jolla, Strain CCCM 725" /LENGTH=66 /DNA_ID=CAMNT_0010929829 /DNA_START=32 /DNA_END=229 /DNA_ORIENTATION=+
MSSAAETVRDPSNKTMEAVSSSNSTSDLGHLASSGTANASEAPEEVSSDKDAMAQQGHGVKRSPSS